MKTTLKKGGSLFIPMLAAMVLCLLVPADKANAADNALVQSLGKITGKVVDQAGDPMGGATVAVAGTTRGVITDLDGSFSLDVLPTDEITVSYLGYDTRVISLDGRDQYIIVLNQKANEMEGVTVVAFGKQKKESVIASVSTVNPSELKVPSSNMTTALGGRISGIISHQLSGEPGRDNAEFFIRGVTTFNEHARGPLILIDNVELTTNDLARLQPDDIASFSVMKDATATALYGARGANGVILVTTKEGIEGKAKLNIRFENSFSMPTRNIEIVDPVSYMRYHNEAVMTRWTTNQNSYRPYTDKKIEATERGINEYYYPAVNWYDELFKKFTTNQRLNMNVSGGGNVARYYVAGTFNNDNGILKNDKQNSYTNNIKLTTIQLRSNTNINLTKTTQLNVRVNGTFDDYNGPLESGETLYRKVMAANPVLFPKYYPAEANSVAVGHKMFGNTASGDYLNPYAEMVRGYKEYSQMVLVAQLELKEDLGYLTEGLGLRALGSTTRNSYFDVQRYINPFYYTATYYDPNTNKYGVSNVNPDSGTEYLLYNEGGKIISTAFYFEGAIDYNRTFNEKHAVSGLLVYTMRNELYANQGSLLKSLPYRNMGLAGRFTYGYDSRYFIEGNFGYNGSERFAKKERFGFFPSAGVGWILSNEAFWGESLKRNVNLLKLKATYGLVGNDAIGDQEDRFFYMSNVNLNKSDGRTISFGRDFTTSPYRIGINRYANEYITWEKSKKMNLGIELGLFNKLTIQADYFREQRSNILMGRGSIPSTMGLHAGLRSNVGEAKAHGYEVSMDYNHYITNDFWITGRFNFTYATSRYKTYEEVDYGYWWKSFVGQPIGQGMGYIAERLFIDEADIYNSPTQSFGTVMPGDIKYKDINGDGVIDELDKVPIGYPSVPNIVYGFGASMGFKGFDFSFFFQGAAQTGFFIDPVATAPFLNRKTAELGGLNSNTAMLKAWANDYWSESNRNSYAQWPRLSAEVIDNNNEYSTWWLRDGTYLRLKSVELGYTLPKRISDKLHLGGLRLYVSGTNLLTFSKFKIWDVEMGANGLGYPIQKVYNIGVNINF